VVLTHDLDFGAMLAAGGDQGPSVVQVRAAGLSGQVVLDAVIAALAAHGDEIERGARLSVDMSRRRICMLPLKRVP
jgi:predicted nuclease of predicted toxin-antitoxin system